MPEDLNYPTTKLHKNNYSNQKKLLLLSSFLTISSCVSFVLRELRSRNLENILMNFPSRWNTHTTVQLTQIRSDKMREILYTHHSWISVKTAKALCFTRCSTSTFYWATKICSEVSCRQCFVDWLDRTLFSVVIWVEMNWSRNWLFQLSSMMWHEIKMLDKCLLFRPQQISSRNFVSTFSTWDSCNLSAVATSYMCNVESLMDRSDAFGALLCRRQEQALQIDCCIFFVLGSSTPICAKGSFFICCRTSVKPSKHFLWELASPTCVTSLKDSSTFWDLQEKPCIDEKHFKNEIWFYSSSTYCQSLQFLRSLTKH